MRHLLTALVAALLALAPAQAAGLPPPDSPPLPGWLAFATVPKGKPSRFFWSPSHPQAQAVIFSENWAKVPAGTRLRAITAAGKLDATLVGTGSHPYGCESNAATMTGFRTARPLPEGPVWLAPPGADVSTVPIKERDRKVRHRRTWVAGDVLVELLETGKRRADLIVKTGIRELYKKSHDRTFMEGGDSGPIDIHAPSQTGIPYPIAAFRFGKQGPLAVVLWIQGYEGNGFDVLVVDRGKVRVMDAGAMYFCAF